MRFIALATLQVVTCVYDGCVTNTLNGIARATQYVDAQLNIMFVDFPNVDLMLTFDSFDFDLYFSGQCDPSGALYESPQNRISTNSKVPETAKQSLPKPSNCRRCDPKYDF